MKMTRIQMKQLIKECLVEILAEGLGSSVISQLDNTKKTLQPTQQSIFRDNSRSQSVSQTPRVQNPTNIQSHIYDAAKKNSGGNKIMENILLDTAATTLTAMASVGDSAAIPQMGKAHGMSQTEQIVGTPEQVFGEDVTSKWADLAFMDLPTKK